MAGLFPFVSINSEDKQLTFEPINEDNEISPELTQAIKEFEQNFSDYLEIEDCSDPDVVEFIIPAFNQFVEDSELSEEDIAYAETLMVYSAAYVEDQQHLIVFVQFGDLDPSDGDLSVEDDSEEDWE